MFSRILIANRGEIALRIIRACRELGVQTVAVYSEADRDAPYLSLADETICIGPKEASESYLNISRIVSAAEVSNVEAIHPGYGFLAENAHFNEVCRSCRIDFIGPLPQAMEMLGDKNQARRLAREAKVPIVPMTPLHVCFFFQKYKNTLENINLSKYRTKYIWKKNNYSILYYNIIIYNILIYL